MGLFTVTGELMLMGGCGVGSGAGVESGSLGPLKQQGSILNNVHTQFADPIKEKKNIYK